MKEKLSKVANFFLNYISENDQFVFEYLSADDPKLKKRKFGMMYGKCKKVTSTDLSYDVCEDLFSKLITKIFSE